jgi:hypothetical protein
MRNTGWRFILVLFSLSGMASHVEAQSFDLRDPNQSMFHIVQLHAIYAGLSQTINLNCGGNVNAYADRFIRVADMLPEDLRKTYAGAFGEALHFGEAYGCNKQKLNLFSEWESIYFQGLTIR